MKVRLIALILTALGGLCLIGPAFGAEDEVEATQQEGVEVQARGQIHEAYAEATATTAEPGVVVTKEPPAAIEEQPPEEKPEGDNVAWIPGYWAWDEEGEEFVWISGFWRVVPPGRTWIPGHWQKVNTGHQWVSGYWGETQSEDSAEEQEYLPEPPASQDVGPSTPAPAEDYTYVPGIWVYQTSKFVWRPGYWVRPRLGWVWVPACYKWTPAGCVFVTGYWDAPLCERGLLFAPVRFSRNVFVRRGFVYRPAYVIQPDFIVGSLFVRAKTRTYYFGNYFEASHRRRYVSWVDYRMSRGVVDVNFSYYRATYVKHVSWERNLRTLYSARYSGDVARPPLTLVHQTKAINSVTVNRTTNTYVHKNVNLTNVQNVTVLTPVKKASTVRVTALAPLAGIKLTEMKTAPVNRAIKVERISTERAREERRQVERIAVISRERKAAETKVVARLPKDGKLTTPVKVKVELPKSAPAPRVIKAPVAPPPAPVKIRTELKPVAPKKDVPVKKDPPPVKRDLPPVKDTPPVKRDVPPVKKEAPPVKKTETPPVVRKIETPPPVKKDTPPQPLPRSGNVTPVPKKDVPPAKQPPPIPPRGSERNRSR